MRDLASPADALGGVRARGGDVRLGRTDPGSPACRRDLAAARPRRVDPHPGRSCRGLDPRDRPPGSSAARGLELRPLGPVAPRRSGHLDVHAASSVAYLAKLARLQKAAAAQVRAAIPQAQIAGALRGSCSTASPSSSRPSRSPSCCASPRASRRSIPSLSYTRDDGPRPERDPRHRPRSGDGPEGRGHQDRRRRHRRRLVEPVPQPDGFSYPAGFPKGDTKLTTPKVIVAKVFPGPGARRVEQQGVRPTEPHGTHVSGIAAGDEGTTAPAGTDHPQVTNLSGVAPKAWIGNYRVFTVPTPLGHEANTPEIVAGVRGGGRRRHERHQLLGRRAADAIPRTTRCTRRSTTPRSPGVVPVIAAGNDREDFGLGTAGSPGTAPDAITVAATSNSHVFAPALSVVGGPPSLGAIPIQGAGGAKLPGSMVDARPDRSSTSRRSWARTASPSSRISAGPPSDPNTGLGTLPKDSVKGKIVLVSRGICTLRLEGGARGARRRDRPDPDRQPLRRGEPDPDPAADPVRDDLRPGRRSSCAPTRRRTAARRRFASRAASRRSRPTAPA